MPSIVPISDLKNYSEVLRSCDQGATVYLTKNGRGNTSFRALLNMKSYRRPSTFWQSCPRASNPTTERAV